MVLLAVCKLWAAVAGTHILFQDILDLAELIGQLLILVLAQVLVCFAALSHFDTKLKCSLWVGLLSALVLLPLLLSVKVISGAPLLLLHQAREGSRSQAPGASVELCALKCNDEPASTWSVNLMMSFLLSCKPVTQVQMSNSLCTDQAVRSRGCVSVSLLLHKIELVGNM